MRLTAPAKINLHLKVLGRRPDGYHELCSLMAKVSLADELCLKPRPSGGESRLAEIVNLTGRPLPEGFSGPGNLILKAIRAYQQAAGGWGGFEIRLVKRIPLGAGLGGGSSDGAAILSFLNGLGQAPPLNEKSLVGLALKLGADLPFFLWPYKAAWVEGIGERLRPGLALGSLHLLLVNPGVHLNTGEVFRSLALTPSPRPATIPQLFTAADTDQTAGRPSGWRDSLSPSGEAVESGGWGPNQNLVQGSIWAWPDLGRNDLLPAAARLCPAVGQLARHLEAALAETSPQAGRLAWGLSGSGPTFWVMAEERAPLAALEARLRRQGGPWWFQLARLGPG